MQIHLSLSERSRLKTTAAKLLKIKRKDLVDLVGIEPTTSSMPWKRAPSCATGPQGGFDLLSLRRGESSNPSASGQWYSLKTVPLPVSALSVPVCRDAGPAQDFSLG